jgi:hypothetical protein
MTPVRLLLIAVGSTIIFSLSTANAEEVASTMAQVADPFEISKQNCIDKGWIETKCLTTNEASGVFPISLVIDQLNSSIERLRSVNGWGEEVTPETLVPIGSTFAFG